MADIDWTKPIELSDGTPAKVIKKYGFCNKDIYQVSFDAGHRDAKGDGTPVFPDGADTEVAFYPAWKGRTVRNVSAKPETFLVISRSVRCVNSFEAAEAYAKQLVSDVHAYYIAKVIAEVAVTKPEPTTTMTLL